MQATTQSSYFPHHLRRGKPSSTALVFHSSCWSAPVMILRLHRATASSERRVDDVHADKTVGLRTTEYYSDLAPEKRVSKQRAFRELRHRVATFVDTGSEARDIAAWLNACRAAIPRAGVDSLALPSPRIYAALLPRSKTPCSWVSAARPTGHGAIVRPLEESIARSTLYGHCSWLLRSSPLGWDSHRSIFATNAAYL